MSRLPEPRRLLSRAPKASAVGLALTAAQAREPRADELRALADSLLGLMDDAPGTTHPAGAPSAATPGTASGTLAVARRGRALVTKLAALALLAGGVWWGLRQAPQGPPAPPPTAVELAKPPPSERSSQMAAAPSLAAPASAEAAPCANPPCDPKPQVALRRADARPSTPDAARSSRAADAGPNELQLIDEARQALHSSPARALALASQHERRFPHGSMAEERDVIRISALVGLGQIASARALASEFLRVNSGSAYARRVEAVLSSTP